MPTDRRVSVGRRVSAGHRVSAGEWASLAVGLCVFFAIRWPFRGALLVRDEGEYAHLGQEILRGAIPYLDVYNQKTPLVFYWMAGVESLFGNDLVAIRLATTLWLMLAGVLVFVAARRILGRESALWSALAFLLMAFDQAGVVHQASTEMMMLPFMAAGLVAAHARPGASRGGGMARWLLAGACAGLAFQTKQTAVAFAAYLVLERFLLEAPRRALVHAALVAAGFAAVLLAVVAAFAMAGALGPYIDCTFVNNFAYVGEGRTATGPGLGLLTVAFAAGRSAAFWVVGPIGLVQAARSRERRSGRGLWLLLALTFAIAVVGGRRHVHYFEPMIVPLALGVGAFQARLASRAGAAAGWRRTAWTASLAAAWLLPLYYAVGLVADPGRALETSYAVLSPIRSAPIAADFVRERTRPDEPVVVVGSEPEIYFYADRPAGTRMAFSYPMTGGYAFGPELRRQFLDRLARSGPRWVVLSALTRSLAEDPAEAQAFRNEVSDILAAHYRLEAVLPESLLVYRREEAAGDS